MEAQQVRGHIPGGQDPGHHGLWQGGLRGRLRGRLGWLLAALALPGTCDHCCNLRQGTCWQLLLPVLHCCTLVCIVYMRPAPPPPFTPSLPPLQVGSEVARRAKGLGMDVIAHDPYASEEKARAVGVQLVSFDDALSRADFYSLHMPLTPTTKKMFNDDCFSKMKKGARIINVARGGVIDDDALARALDAGIVAQAALDVFAEEPPPATHPLINRPDVICTPHLGASTTGEPHAAPPAVLWMQHPSDVLGGSGTGTSGGLALHMIMVRICALAQLLSTACALPLQRPRRVSPSRWWRQCWTPWQASCPAPLSTPPWCPLRCCGSCSPTLRWLRAWARPPCPWWRRRWALWAGAWPAAVAAALCGRCGWPTAALLLPRCAMV